MRKIIKAALVQYSPGIDTNNNKEVLKSLISEASGKGAELIILPELHDSLYFCQTEDVQNFKFADIIPGPSTEYYSGIAKENKVVLVTSLFEKRAPGLFHNTAVVFDKDGSIAGKYRKMHIPDDPAYYEKFYFTPGDLGFEPINTSIGKLGVLVCWDQWYPEAARMMALKGADILIYPTAIGWKVLTLMKKNKDNLMHGRQFKNLMLLQMVFLLFQLTDSDTKKILQAKLMEYLSGETVLLPDHRVRY